MGSKSVISVALAASMVLSARVAVAAAPCQPMKCVEIKSVTVSAGSAEVKLSADPFYVGRWTVRWKLPEGYVFTSSDGVFVQNHVGEVGDGTIEDDDGGATGMPAKRYRLKVKRTLAAKYKYDIRFHELNGGKPTKLIECDPTIANFSGTGGPKDAKRSTAPADVPVSCTVREAQAAR